MNKNDPLRTLARSSRWQTLYSRAKELNINLFENNSDFSDTQLVLLQYLELYHSIYVDIASGEKLIDHDRIKRDILVDSYLVYKYRHKDDDKNRQKRTKKRDKFKGEGKRVNDLPQIVFKQRRKS